MTNVIAASTAFARNAGSAGKVESALIASG